jgi:peptidoglycan hydrolase-like protein with peptidoglycan-binding domain
MLTRSSFGAYDRTVWTVQWILQNLDYDPGPLDGLWGSQTLGATFDFRNIEGLPPASGISQAAALDSEFMNALYGAAVLADLTVAEAPTSGVSGGTSTTPRATGTGATPGAPRGTVGPGTTAQAGALDMTMILALGAVGLGAILLYGGKKGRR